MTQGIDISNYTSPLTDAQIQYVRDNYAFVIIGLQSKSKALAFKEQLAGMALEYYLDKPGRDLSITHDGSRVWIDVEVGCFTQVADVEAEVLRIHQEGRGLRPGIYCNKVSLGVLDAPPPDWWARLPLWYADYRTPDLATFRPFNGWTEPLIWQYSSNGVAGINCDMNVSYEEVTMPEDKALTPEQVTTICACVSAGEFTRRGWDVKDMLPEDKQAIIALAERMK